MTIALKTYVRLFYNFVYDMRRFLRNSSIRLDHRNAQTKLRALIVMDCHRLEKGMALKEPRLGFGKDVIGRLLANLPPYTKEYGWDQTAIMTLNVLRSYCDFNSSRGFDVTALAASLADLSEGLDDRSAAYCLGGVKEVTKAEIHEAVKFDAKQFFGSRYSIRNYSEGEVPLSLIEQAVKMAQKTPSVCNRQSSKVYVFGGSKEKLGVLGLQTGNRGFGEQADKVLVVASDLEHFTDVGERNQCWIDGGMFAMSLVYALHSLGVGSCCLNWSVGAGKDRALKRLAGIPDKDSIIMMISVGHLPERLVVTHSPLKPIEEVLFVK